MKASRKLQSDLNVLIRRALPSIKAFDAFDTTEADYKAQSLPPERCRWDLLWSTNRADRVAFFDAAYADGLSDDHIDTVLRQTISDIFGPGRWAATK